jgi:hypothetical protein
VHFSQLSNFTPKSKGEAESGAKNWRKEPNGKVSTKALFQASNVEIAF